MRRLFELSDKGSPGTASWWKFLLIWLGLIAAIAALTTSSGLFTRMGCRPSTSRRMICRHSLFSPEAWAPTQQPLHRP